MGVVCFARKKHLNVMNALGWQWAFWISVSLALYPYAIYAALLWIGCRLLKRDAIAPTKESSIWEESVPAVSVIVAAYNEERLVGRKIEQVLETIRGKAANELIVVSDHSTDRTLDVAGAIANSQLRVFSNEGDRGRAGAHNFAVSHAMNEVLVFTDVETRVPRETLIRMAAAFRQREVGCANAEISFSRDENDEVAEASGSYWRFEMWLRAMETKLNLYATSSGPCMALRRALYRELPVTGDVDFTSPLDVVDQGSLCVHLSGALAFDVMPANDRAEFRVRVRMVAKNFSGTLQRWGLVNLVKRPGYSWAIYSHKILRWLTPFFMLGALISNIALAGRAWWYGGFLFLQFAFYLAALVGWYAYRRKTRWPIVGQMYAFVLANVAFAAGILKVLMGTVPTFYVPTRQFDV